MRGYIKLYRQIAENAIWLIKPFSEGQAWVDLLCIATFDKGFIKTKNGQIIELTAGDCGYSQLSLSERWGWSRGKVKRFILLLEKQNMIQQKMYGKYSVINILNYEKYQNRTTNDTTNDTTNEQQMIQQTNTINNDKNDKNDNNIISLYQKQITEREREILYAYCKRQNIKNKNAFIRKLIDNGDYVYVVDEELKHQNYIAKLKEEEELQNKQNRKVEDPAFTEQAYLKFRETVTNRRSSRNETMGKSLGNVTVETCNNNGNNQ